MQSRVGMTDAHMQCYNQLHGNVRHGHLDIARGIGLILVVLGHLVTYGGQMSGWIFSFHMPLFFFISGCCFVPEKYTFIQFIKKKVKSLIVPYFGFVLLGLAVTLIISSWRNGLSIYTIKEIFYYTGPETVHVGQVWFLWALFIVEVMFYTLHKYFLNRVNRIFTPVALILASILGYYLPQIINVPGYGRLPWKLDTALTAIVFFALGYYFKRHNVLERISQSSHIFILLFLEMNVVFGVWLNGMANIAIPTLGNYFFYYVAAISGILFVVLFSMLIKKSAVLEYFGKNSLLMFALHSFLLNGCEYLLTKIKGEEYVIMNNIPPLYSFLFTILICTVLALIVHIKCILKNQIKSPQHLE